MKKKKLKTSFKSLLEEEDDILSGKTIPPEIDLSEGASTDGVATGIKEIIPDSDFINRLREFEPGDLVEGIEILEAIDLMLTGSAVEKSKKVLLKKIKEILENVVKNGENNNHKKLKSLIDKLEGEKSIEHKMDTSTIEAVISIDLPDVAESTLENIPETISVKVEDAEIMGSFIQEAKEHLADIEEKILKFENSGDMALLNTIFRSVHTVKGTSAFLDLDSVKSLSHRLEFLLDEVRNGSVKVDSTVVDVLLEGTDFLGIMIDELAEQFRSSMGNIFTIPSHQKEISELEEKFNSLGSRASAGVKNTSDEIYMNVNSEGGESLISDEIAESFAAESSALLEEAEQLLLELEKDRKSIGNVDTIFRNIHTIKGNAGFLGFTSVERICMQMESTLDTIRKDKKQVSQGVISMLLHSLDIITRNIVSPNAPEEGAEPEVKALGEILLDDGKIGKEDLEKALDIQEMKVGEILLTEGKISKNDLESALIKQEAQQPKGVSGKTEASLERKDIRVDMTKIDKLFNLMGELITAEDIIIHNPEIEKLKNLERSINYLTKITREMQEITMSIRMIPLEGLFNRMRRLVRDLSKKVGKKVDLHIFGQDTEMDKNVTEEIADPLVHIIRNSLDHGLESRAIRLEKGKDEAGKISLGARYEGNEIWIIVTDDGAGLDREKILAKAVSSGIVESDGSELSDEEVWALVFAPGFSTAEVVTEVSGRGVGMDVVRSNIEKLRGKISIKSERDKGTEITLKIPLTLAIMDGVTVKVGNIIFALPIGDIREFHKASMSHITVAESGKEVLKLRDSIIPVIKLARVYDQKTGVSSINEGILLIVEANDKKAAFLVDEIIGYHQIVVKALPESLKGLSSISGCSIMGNGEVNLIIDCGSLLNEVLI